MVTTSAHGSTTRYPSRACSIWCPCSKYPWSEVAVNEEFYSWPLIAQVAKKSNVDGSPVLNRSWFKYSTDTTTFGIDLQCFFGDSILVCNGEHATTVTIYFPKDKFYNMVTLKSDQGTGPYVTLTDVNFTTIQCTFTAAQRLPLWALVVSMTTTELWATDFEFVVAPGTDGMAAGTLYHTSTMMRASCRSLL